MPQKRHILALALAIALGAGAAAGATCARPGPEVDVAVGVRTAPPFVMSDPVRGRRGLNFDLWESIAGELAAAGRIGPTAYVDCPLGEQLDALARGDIDLVISPLTITAERLERLDFTHQYLSSGLTVAQRATNAIDFRYATGILRETVTHPGVPMAILAFLLANLVLAAVTARSLRAGDLPATAPLPVRLFRQVVETMIRTIGLRGIGDGGRSTAVRMVEIFMGVVGTVLSATIFGVLTTALVGSIGASREVTLADLAGHRVATLADSTAQAFLRHVVPGPAPEPRLERISLGAAPPPGTCVAPRAAAAGTARCLAAASWEEAMQLLAEGTVDLVFGDWAQLSYLARQPAFAGKVSVQSSTFRLEPYGWGVSPRRPELRAAIDRALMARVRSTEWRFVVQEYMGSGSISPE